MLLEEGNSVEHVMRLAIVIVNYRTAGMVRECIASLEDRLSEDSIAYDLFVVDNDSGDGSYEKLASAYEDRPNVEVIQAGRNLGYGAGNNLVLRRILASNEYDTAWLLNPDTVILNGIPSSVRELLARPAVAAVGSRLEDPDTTPQTSAFRFPGWVSEFLQAARLSLFNRWLGRWRVVQPIANEAVRTDWLAGASVLFKLEALKEVGLFDEAFFLYYEEVDLFRRLKEAGWQSWYCPEMRVVHHVGASTGISDHRRRVGEMPRYWYESRSYYFRKCHGTLGAIWIDLCWLMGRSTFLTSRLLLRRGDRAAVTGRGILTHNALARSWRESTRLVRRGS